MSYRISGPWRFSRDDWAHGHHIVVEVADLVDHRGRVYEQGAYHVKLDGKVLRTFKGETAWGDADSLVGDTRYRIMREGIAS